MASVDLPVTDSRTDKSKISTCIMTMMMLRPSPVRRYIYTVYAVRDIFRRPNKETFALSDTTCIITAKHVIVSVKCQLSDYVFLRRVPRRTIIAKTSNLHQKVGYRQDYKYRKLHAYTPITLTVVLSLVPTRKNQLSATGTYYRKSLH